MSDFGGIEVWRGGVNTWECDAMGHLNVRFYVARALEGLVGLAGALGLPGAFRANAETTLQIRDQHIRFLREAHAGGALHMLAGVLEMGEESARLFHLLVHSATGEPAASFQTVVDHVTRDGRAFPWTRRSLALGDALRVSVPDGTGPRGLGLAPSRAGASLEAATRLGLVPIAAGAVGPADCDVFGAMRAEMMVGRISDGIPSLTAAFAVRDRPAATPASRRGGAVLEYRTAYFAWPRAGDRFEIRSGVTGVDARTTRYVHWMLDPASGRAWGSAAAVAVSLDLDARKIIPVDPDLRRRLEARIHPDLAF